MHPGARQDQFSLFTHTSSRASSSHPYDSLASSFSRMPVRSSIGRQGQEWPGYRELQHEEMIVKRTSQRSRMTDANAVIRPPKPHNPQSFPVVWESPVTRTAVPHATYTGGWPWTTLVTASAPCVNATAAWPSNVTSRSVLVPSVTPGDVA
jgi:hypothetical protein